MGTATPVGPLNTHIPASLCCHQHGKSCHAPDSKPNNQSNAKIATTWSSTQMTFSACHSLVDAADEPHAVCDTKVDISNRSRSQVLPTRVTHKHAMRCTKEWAYMTRHRLQCRCRQRPAQTRPPRARSRGRPCPPQSEPEQWQ